MNKYILENLCKNEFIKEDEVEEFCYGINVIKLKLLHIFTILFIGIIFKKLLEIIIYLVLFTKLRENLGGFHAKNKVNCFLISIFSTLVFCLGFKFVNYFYSAMILYIFLFIIIYFFVCEKNIKNKMSIFFLILLSIFVFLIDLENILYSIFFSLIYCLFLKLISTVKINDN